VAEVPSARDAVAPSGAEPRAAELLGRAAGPPVALASRVLPAEAQAAGPGAVASPAHGLRRVHRAAEAVFG